MPTHPLRRTARWIALALAGFTALVALLALELVGRAHRALPDYDGQVALPGLEAPVEVVRDRHAIPHITAANDRDAAFALGYAHAQDRLWQMELLRRVTQGRLAEIFGAPALPADRLVRTLDLHGHAARALDALSPPARAVAEAYAAGVNAWLATRDRPLPPEFQLLWHTPDPWQAADSLALVKLLSAGLSRNAFAELLRARLVARLGEEALAGFDPPYPADARPAIRKAAALYRGLALDRLFATLPDTGPPGASNNWVVDGSWTRSGKPLLANDPHLGMLAPSVWYGAHLRIDGANIIGVTIPGIPSVVLGRNDHIAWGFTNTGPDTQDLVIERVNPDDPGTYLTPEGWQPFRTRTQIIRVRFGADETLRTRHTRNGPVLNGAAPDLADVTPEGHVLALRWTALADDDTTLEAGWRFTRARSVAEFDAAARLHVTPMQSMVVADVAGNIGLIAPGRVPIRAPGHETGGLAPARGWLPENAWTGYIPHAELPRSINPPHGYIATANNRIVPPDYPHFISASWDPPYRARRIEQMIEARRDHDVASFEAMLADNLSLFAVEMLPHLRAVAPTSGRMKEALALLAGWDGRMEKDLPQPLIFHAWLRHLHTRLYGDELGDLAPAAKRRRELFIVSALAGEAPAARWCDDVTTPARETCPDIVRLALADALDELADMFGDEPARWRWGTAHPVVNNHLPFGAVPGLRAFFNIERPSAGGPYTVNRGQTGDGPRPYANVHAAGYRAVFDLADPGRSVYVISTGQSGNPASPWYADFADIWARGAHVPMSTRESDYRPGAIGTLRLEPAPSS